MEQSVINQSDHDLLIELRTNQRNLIDEMRLMRDDSKQSIKGLEVSKLDAITFAEYKVFADNERTRIVNESKRKSEDQDRKTDETAKDIKNLQKIAFVGIGITLTIQFFFSILPTLLTYFHG